MRFRNHPPVCTVLAHNHDTLPAYHAMPQGYFVYFDFFFRPLLSGCTEDFDDKPDFTTDGDDAISSR